MAAMEVLLILALIAPGNLWRITVDTSAQTTPFQKFWKSTGFSPPKGDPATVKEYLLSKDVKVNLALIASLPMKGIQYVRIHWLLSLISWKDNGFIIWDPLDEIIKCIVGHGLKPIIELMGNTSILARNKGNRFFWQDLTSKVAKRYIEMYGEKEVLNWMFETWNEPDLAMYNTLRFPLQEYLDYVEGSVAGLKSVHPEIQVGGPAGLFKAREHHPLCWNFLKHCNKDQNRCHLNYISYHKKGNGTSSEILKESLRMRNILQRRFPSLAQLPMVNDEADILSGWWKPEDWRGDARYAAAVVRTVYLFKQNAASTNIQRISIDNGFLNEPPFFFDQRTLVTRFLSNNDSVGFVQKPVFAAMGLLGMLGEEEMPIKIIKDPRISYFVTCTKDTTKSKILSLSILVAMSTDSMEINETKTDLRYKITFSKPLENARYSLYTINDDLPSPKSIWEKHGSPPEPDSQLLRNLQSNQEPREVLHGVVEEKKFKIGFAVPQPSVTLLHICSDKVDKPGKIMRLEAFNISYNHVMLKWNEPISNVRCIKTFVVEHREIHSEESNFKRINDGAVFYNSFSFVHVTSSFKREFQEGTRGSYRVAALDYWERLGPYSDPILYTSPF